MGSGVALPTDAVLFFLLLAIVLPSNDALHFPFGFFINDVWWWLNEVSPMFGSVMPQGLSYVPRVYLYLYSAIYVSRLLMCTTGPPYRSYWTSLLSRYLAALDLLTRHGSPAYLGHTSHARAAPSTHTYLYCFWHA